MSSWSVFLAYTGFVTGMSPAASAHSVMHVILYLLILSVYWRLSSRLFADPDPGKARKNRMIFMYFVQLIILIVFGFMLLYEDGRKWSYWIILLMTAMSMCHMSAMGIVMSAVMIASFGLYTAVAKKSIRILILSMICCIPSGVYFMISQMTDYMKYLQN